VSTCILRTRALTYHRFRSDFLSQLAYVNYSGRGPTLNAYYISDGVISVSKGSKSLSYPAITQYRGSKLPVLCTQSWSQSQPATAVATSSNELAIRAADNTYVGFRNQKSFRFLGIRYADPPQRFTYSRHYSGKGQVLQATSYGPQCLQGDSGSEDCLYLNIQTPYIPKAGSSDNLRPVMFWIHGGGFVAGTGADYWSDGGNLASREDIVVVTINYRLSTLGFFAVPGTNITGNYGIGDQVNALKVSTITFITFAAY
jgi:hypothetical protein